MKMTMIELPDGSKWGVPVEVIARSRATHYAHEFEGDIERSMAEDTLPLFESDDYEVKDWASNNMNWEDVSPYAKKLQDAPPPDFQKAWTNGEKSVIDFASDEQQNQNEATDGRSALTAGSRSNDVLESKPQWRAECIYCAGWGAKRWAVFFVDGNGTAVEQSMHNGKKRTFLREARAEAEAARLNAAMLSNA